VIVTRASNQAMQRTATRCAITLSHDKNTSTSIGARSRQRRLSLFSLGVEALLLARGHRAKSK